jgi:hypothetical protein
MASVPTTFTWASENESFSIESKSITKILLIKNKKVFVKFSRNQ